MKKEGSGKLILSPSDLVRFVASPFASWMDRFDLEFPKQITADLPSEEDQILWRKGLEHEKALLARLKEEGRDVFEVPEKGDRSESTRTAMREGREIIYQASLEAPPFAGYADFLERVQGPSGLGEFHYRVSDTKLARDPRPKFLLQLCAYADMLLGVQQRLPGHVSVILRDGQPRHFRTEDYVYCYRIVKQEFLRFIESFDPNKPPIPEAGADHGRWHGAAEKILADRDHLSRCAGITRVQMKKLVASKVETLTALANCGLTRIPKLSEDIFCRLKEQASLQLSSTGKTVPAFRVVKPSPSDPRKGLALLPPASPSDVYFDMEGYPHFEGGLEYLFGITYLEGGNPQYRDWWAHSPLEEKKAFEEFIDWVHARWKADPAMHIYHYASYEVAAMRRLMGSHGTREDAVDDLLRNEVFVDLYLIVRNGLRVGTSSYSIKAVESLYREARKGDVKEAGASIVFYQRWLDGGEGKDWQTSSLLKSIRDYNRDDCESTWQLTEWMRARQTEAGILWTRKALPGDENASKEKVSEVPPERVLAEALIKEIPPDPAIRAKNPERWKLQLLLAQLLEFHRREAKPVWWAMFDRHAMTETELVDDLACLGGLVRTNDPLVPIRRSTGFWYSYDPDQDTKLDAGEKCRCAHDLRIKPTIESLDRETGRVLLAISNNALATLEGGTLPDRISLIPDEYVSADIIAESIYDTVLKWRTTGEIPQAISDYLCRRSPRVAGRKEGSLADPGEGTGDAALRIIPQLEQSSLCIQGPPGAGKTYTAAKVILTLIGMGKRVGITATSHKAIINLMKACAEQAGNNLPCVKIQRDDKDSFFREVQGARVAKDVDGVNPGDLLVGGTAWAFSAAAFETGFDYLFVDEAGQVSVANLVGISRSARNLVLIGDQMQLGQPTRGSHPGESGLSVMDYFLQGKATIPPDLGLFLDKTRRLHPGICSFISGAIYEGRLQSEAFTANRVVRIVPEQPVHHVPVEAGLLFVPVDHEGNSQASDEEVAVVRQIVEEVAGRILTNEVGLPERKVDLGDILVVAPYNMQVRKLQTALGPAAKVGSVDRFQGQEAPIVIVSMCASDGESTARGLDFLLNRQRLNVAISRARSLAVVVASSAIAKSRPSTLVQMSLLNTFCRIVEEGSGKGKSE